MKSLALAFVLIPVLTLGGCHSSPPKSGEPGTLPDLTTAESAGDMAVAPDLAGPTSCEGVTCNLPPAKSCQDPQTLLVYDPAGTCSDGKCSYVSHTESCAGGCANGACTDNPCQGVTCNLPPPNHCVDGNTLAVPSSSGSCAGGACHYSESLATCPFGCANDACVDDPCIGRTCNQPPATFCLTANTLRTFQTAGTCSGGGCLYAPTDATCTFGCAAGACADDPCAGKVCNQPPASACISAYALRVFAASGTCGGGSCLYGHTDMTCAYGCAGGACNGDPCAGVTCNLPPANSCLDATTLRSFAAPGGCAGGACTYQPQVTTCAFGCSTGACAGDPCTGVTCNTPPAAACVNPTTLRSFSPSGSCNGGACSYVPTDTPCSFGCGSGHCLEDPCIGVLCNTPPGRACVSGNARVYSPSGSCSGGTCSYGFTDTPCDHGCAGGYCNPPSCGAVTCNTPPASSCTNANRLHSYFPVGSCAADTCNYVAYDIDCSQGCINGACIAGSWTLESTPYGSALDSGNGVLDADGEPVLVGCQGGAVRIRHRTRQGWKEEVVDSGMGSCEARVALDAAGEPMVAYTDAVNQDLRFALRNGGTWSPKELVANTGAVGGGLSLVFDGTKPLVSYRAPGEIRLAARAAGSWSEETLPGVTGWLTELRLDGTKPKIFISGTPDAHLAAKGAGGWTVMDTPVGNNSLEVLRQSFTTDGRLFLKGTNPVSGNNNWSFRSIDGDGYAMRSEDLGNDTPLAMRSDGPAAVYARRPYFASTIAVIRARKNGAWEEIVNPVPWSNNFGTPMMYTGGTRHVLVDQYARRLLSPAGCAPQCSGRACGDDGCGGSCGSCGGGNSCAPTGVCAPLLQSTMPGFAPSRTAMGSGTVAHAVDTSYSAYVPQLHRSAAGGVWQAPSPLPQITVALGSTRVIVDANDLPRVILNGTIAAQTGAHLASRDAAGNWTTELISATQGGSLGIDAAGTLYFAQCGSSSITLRTKPAAGAWSAPATIYTRPGGYTGMSCSYLAVSSSGVVALPVANEYWNGSPIYDYRYQRGMLTNESGSFQFIDMGSGLTSYVTGEVVIDPAGAMHALTDSDYRVRPAMGSFASEALPAGLSAGAKRAIAADKNGAVTLAWLTGSQLVNLSKRTAPGVWTTDSAPTLSSVNPNLSQSVTLHGLAFDAANQAYILVNEGDTYRSLSK